MDRKKEFLQQVAIIDFETTGLNFDILEVIEYGVATRKSTAWNWHEESYLCKPKNPIPVAISAITNITDEMVIDKKHFEDYGCEHLLEITDEYDYYVAHHAPYDQKVLQLYTDKSKPWICVIRLTKLLFSDDANLEQHNLNYLRYYFKLPVKQEGLLHRAGFDAMVTGLLLEYLVGVMEDRGLLDETIPYGVQILDYLNSPIIYKVMPYGKKYKGELLENIPLDYWQWALSNMDKLNQDSDKFDPDFSASVETVLSEKLELN